MDNASVKSECQRVTILDSIVGCECGQGKKETSLKSSSSPEATSQSLQFTFWYECICLSVPLPSLSV